MIVGILNEIPDGQSSCLFSNKPFDKKPVMTIEHFVGHSDDHFVGCNNGGGGGKFSKVKRLVRKRIETRKRLFFGVSSFWKIWKKERKKFSLTRLGF